MPIYCPISEALGIQPPDKEIDYDDFSNCIPMDYVPRKHSEEVRRAISEANKGKPKSEIQKKKQSDTMKALYGKKENHPFYGRTGENNPNYGKKRPKHSERMSGEQNPMFGKSVWNGRKHSEETLSRMREARKLYWAKRRGE